MRKVDKKEGLDPSISNFANPVNVFVDSMLHLKVELWLRPDGIKWDSELLQRRRREKIGKAEVWVVSPEDFIVTKSARKDRQVQDEKM
ncbi:MAG: nucleotidyltransferase [Nitrososphaerota archaeon]